MGIRSYFDIDDAVWALGEQAEAACAETFRQIDRNAEENTARVLRSFSDSRVSEAALGSSTGYGYGDLGRDVLDAVMSRIMGTEDALVRHNFVSGTHAISVALFGLLRPGDRMVSVTGAPYDTLEPVIGLAGTPGDGSLKDYGVIYSQIDLRHDGTPDLAAIEKRMKGLGKDK